MKTKKSKWSLERFGFGDGVIYAILIITSIICVLPVWNVVMVSFSQSAAANAGEVSFWIIKPTLSSYKNIMQDMSFFRSFGISVLRVILGTSMSMILMFIMSYPLSKETEEFPMRNMYMWFIVATMLFSGGMIPTYMVVMKMGLKNTIWSLTVPGAVSSYNTILMINYFRNLPKELSESAAIDGATPMRTLIRIYLPVSVPVIATLTLFCALWHWNDYFQGMIYIDNAKDYPLMTYIKSLTLDTRMDSLTAEELRRRAEVGTRTFNAAKIVIAMIPVLCVYPFVQKYFVKGIMLGSVKG